MTMTFSDPRTVGPRIRMMMPHLTPLEARVVDMILGSRQFDETTSLKTVADDAKVSEAMIVKIAKKLGFYRLQGVPQRHRRLQPPPDGGSPPGDLARRHRARDRAEGLPHLDPRP